MRERSPDGLLERGIDGYTFIPEDQGGVLGRGKFSTVYKVTDIEGVDVSDNSGRVVGVGTYGSMR